MLKRIGLALAIVNSEKLHRYPSIPEEERNRLGVTPGLVRISVGLEDVEDLVADEFVTVEQRVHAARNPLALLPCRRDVARVHCPVRNCQYPRRSNRHHRRQRVA